MCGRVCARVCGFALVQMVCLRVDTSRYKLRTKIGERMFGAASCLLIAGSTVLTAGCGGLVDSTKRVSADRPMKSVESSACTNWCVLGQLRTRTSTHTCTDKHKHVLKIGCPAFRLVLLTSDL